MLLHRCPMESIQTERTFVQSKYRCLHQRSDPCVKLNITTICFWASPVGRTPYTTPRENRFEGCVLPLKALQNPIWCYCLFSFMSPAASLCELQNTRSLGRAFGHLRMSFVPVRNLAYYEAPASPKIRDLPCPQSRTGLLRAASTVHNL